MSRTERMWRFSTGILLVIGLLQTACGGAPGAGTTPSAGSGPQSFLALKSADRQQQLEAAARKEGELDWFTSLAGESVQGIQKAFEQKYPFLHMSVYRAPENNLVTRAVQDAQAGRYTADVFESTLSALLDLREAGLVAPYYSPGVARILPAYKVEDQRGLVWGASDRISYVSFGYNTRTIPSEVAPASLRDLTSPALKGKLGISTTTTGVRWAGSVVHALGIDRARELMAQMARQQVKQEAISAAAVMGLIAQGQLGGSPAVIQDHQRLEAAKGAPVLWKPLEPVVANVGTVLIAAKAPHPAAAVLFADYLLGEDGQKLMASYGYGSGREVPAFKSWAPEAGLSAAEYNQQFKTWQQLFKQTFGG